MQHRYLQTTLHGVTGALLSFRRPAQWRRPPRRSKTSDNGRGEILPRYSRLDTIQPCRTVPGAGISLNAGITSTQEVRHLVPHIEDGDGSLLEEPTLPAHLRTAAQLASPGGKVGS